MHIAYTTLGVSGSAIILRSQTLARAVHSTRSPAGLGQVYPFGIRRRAASLKDAARLGFYRLFWSLCARLPEPRTPLCWPSPFQSAPLLSATRLLPFRPYITSMYISYRKLQDRNYARNALNKLLYRLKTIVTYAISEMTYVNTRNFLMTRSRLLKLSRISHLQNLDTDRPYLQHNLRIRIWALEDQRFAQ